MENEDNELPIDENAIEDIPLEVEIQNLRITLRELNARLLYLKSLSRENKSAEVSEDEVNKTFTTLTEDITSYCIINDSGINLCLEAHAIEEMLNDQENLETQEQLLQFYKPLYIFNDKALTLQNEFISLMEKVLFLKTEDQKEMCIYRDFLKEQKELKTQKLEETHSAISESKRKAQKFISKINIMKTLIIKFVSGSRVLLRKDPFTLELLEKHRKLLSLDSVSSMVQNDKNDS